MLATTLAVLAISPIGVDPYVLDEKVLQAAARCVISKDRQGIGALIMSVPAKEAEALAPLDGIFTSCLARAKAPDTPYVRSLLPGAIAERLYTQSSLAFKSRIVGNAPPIEVRTQRAGIRTAGWPFVPAVAECLVRNFPNEADRLIRTRVGSKSEAQARAAITQGLSLCLDRGQQLSVRPRQLRAEVARAFYRYIYAPVGLSSIARSTRSKLSSPDWSARSNHA